VIPVPSCLHALLARPADGGQRTTRVRGPRRFFRMAAFIFRFRFSLGFS
jgi:hypothetical protein